MSRRRKPRRRPEGTVRFTVECDGREDHPVRRIARVLLKPRPDMPDLNGGYAVEVEYVRAAQDPEDNDYTMPVRADHMTRRFPCSVCGRDVPLRDEGLVRVGLLAQAAGRRGVRLRELSDT